MWYFYIVKCSDKSLYSGITTDLKVRVLKHNDGSASKYTRSRRPVKLVYHESYATKSEALKREAQVKRWTRSKKLSLIDGNKSKLKQLAKRRKLPNKKPTKT